jgi:hypothetical protein
VDVPPATTLVSCDDWEDITGTLMEARITANIGDYCVDFVYYSIGADRQTYQYRMSLTDADFLHAIPPDWRDMVELGGSVATLCCLSTAKTWQVRSDTNVGCWPEDPDCHFRQVTETNARCVFATDGTLDAGTSVPGSWYAVDIANACSLGAGRWAWLRPLSRVDAVLVVPLDDTEVAS